MSTTIYPTEPALLPIQYESNPLEYYQKGYADIQDGLICLKKYNTEPDDTYLIKYYKDGVGVGNPSGGVLIDEENNTFTLNKTETDSIPVFSSGYKIYLGVKLAGLTEWVWLRVASTERVFVEEDGVNL